MQNEAKKHLISVIVPIYNVGPYIAAALESIVRQSIGFRKNIEVIIIDDGSTDDSGTVSMKYAEKYPENIKYVRQDNAGVSKARNTGLKLAQGEYVHFFDGDDILSQNFYSEAIKLLNRTQEIDFVAAKIKFFDGLIDSHPLNYKFAATRVIDTTEDPNNPILHAATCLFRRTAVADVQFDERLSIAEDVKFLSEVLLRKKKYGVVAAPAYYYRKRADATSAIGGKESNKDYYSSVPNYVYQHMLSRWNSGDKPSLAEYTVLYDLAYRLAQKTQSILSASEERTYKQVIKKIVASCSDEAIITNNYLSGYQKCYVLRVKHGNKFERCITTKNGVVYFNDYRLYDHAASSVYLDFLTPQAEGKYKVEGYINGLVDTHQATYEVEVSGKSQNLQFVSRSQREHSFLGDVYYDGGAFEAEVVLPLNSELSFTISTPDKKYVLPLQTGPFTRFGALKLTYRRDNERLFKRLPRAINSMSYSPLRHVYLEMRMIVQILLNWRLNTARSQLNKLLSRNLAQLGLRAKVFEVLKPFLFIAEAVWMIPRALTLRTGYYIAKRYKKRPIWLISDRAMAAGDNGEALFKYLMKRNDCPASVYFVIASKSKDFSRIQQLGPVLKHGSLKHKLLHLLSDKIISSQADVETTNPFIRQLDHYVDLCNFEFVFLQHGIIRHDLSDWLNRFNKNIGLFVVSAKKEYDSIFSNPYYYSKKHVVLSGLPRYDLLQSSPENKIILAPTYRKNLARMKTDSNGKRKYDPLFKTSQYRRFYNDLINDERLLSVMKKHGVVGEFYLHPAFAAQWPDFKQNNVFKLMEFPYDYNKAFREGSLMISDHSSVMFDFAYLRKPVLYAHFDVDTFFQGHTYNESNFFSDEQDGFGKVCYDYNSLVAATIDSIEKHFRLEATYRKRIENFFEYNDTANSARVYSAMIKDRQ